MKRFNSSTRLLVAALAAAALAASVAHVAAAGPAAPEVPNEVQVPAGHKPYLVGHAVGVQIWTCRAVGAGFAWEFVAPRANLYDGNGTLLTTHGAGPVWTARDGSYVKGAVEDRVTVDPTAIPWLRLAAVETSAGDGRLSATTFIQRIATTGGVAPAAAACDAGTAGTTAEVPYTSDYVFWKAHR